MGPISLRSYTKKSFGTYRIIDLDPDEITRTYPNVPPEYNDLKLLVKDDLLLFGNALGGQVPLAPVADLLACLPGLARNLGEVVKIVNVNGEELIDYSGCRYRKAQAIRRVLPDLTPMQQSIRIFRCGVP